MFYGVRGFKDLVTFSSISQGDWWGTPPLPQVLFLLVCAYVSVCARLRWPRDRAVKGTGSGLANAQQGWEREVGNRPTLAVSTETLIWRDAHTHWGLWGHMGVTGQMGEQQEVTLWTGRHRVPYQKEEGLWPQHFTPLAQRTHTNLHTPHNKMHIRWHK